MEKGLKNHRVWGEPSLTYGEWRRGCTAKWRLLGLICLVVSEIKVEFSHCSWPFALCIWFLISMGVWGRRTVASKAVWQDWSNIEDCKWVDQTGTCMGLSAISVIPYSCTGKPRRCKSSILHNTNCWNTSSEVTWFRLCSEFIFSNPYFFLQDKRATLKRSQFSVNRKGKTCVWLKAPFVPVKLQAGKTFEKVVFLFRNSSWSA